MELVYLWVEDYKNIKEQGFNFSPRFECSYDEKTEELIIDEKKDYVSIFPENINVTAIIGENGSGKSRTLECLEKIILSDGELDEFKYILVYFDEVQLYISNIDIETSIQKETVFNDICSLAYKYDISNEEIDYAQHYSTANLHYLTLQKQEIVNILSAKQNDMDSFHISSFMYEPVKIEISLKHYYKLIQEHRKFLDFKKSDEIERILKDITDSYHQYLTICYIRQEGLDVASRVLKNKELLIENIKTPLSLKHYISFFIPIAIMKEFELSKMSQEQKDIYFHEDYWHYFEFDFIDETERRYNHLSHGEKVIFSQLLGVFFYINAYEKLLFLFDEPEIALHPNWQKQYLSEVINLLKKIPKKYHFIFTTHSPFLLSDLSNQDIIYLNKYIKEDAEVKQALQKVGNCKNVSKTVNINPFGANIHTLLSHGFFMENGLMGEFAKSTIDDIIKNLKDEKFNPTMEEKEKLLATIKIIGEDFLRVKLLDMYYKKFDDDLTKKQRKEELLKQKQNIEKELKHYD
ncbi:AAA family ATPase [Sulfurimonas sp.]|uniref:AAA family ATPase n=1 Tax=Sulfurimonas sp. TaxID=2022749 RepID=UPI002B48DE80|nr:AAA family ATPase [Sulfurimonas sp.]